MNSMNSRVFEHPYNINPKDLSLRNRKYVFHILLSSYHYDSSIIIIIIIMITLLLYSPG